MGEGKHLGSNSLVLKVTAPIQETHFATIESTPHRWSHWLLICFICLISSFSLTHQTHRVTYPLVKQISIVTFQLDPKVQESSYIVRDFDKKSQSESSNTLVALSRQALQRRHRNSIQQHDSNSERSLHRTNSHVLHRPGKPHPLKKHFRPNNLLQGTVINPLLRKIPTPLPNELTPFGPNPLILKLNPKYLPNLSSIYQTLLPTDSYPSNVTLNASIRTSVGRSRW